MNTDDARPMRGLFVTGTDTGVGKTVATAAVAAVLRFEGINAGVWKPVQSGGLPGSGATDAERLIAAAELDESPEEVASFSYEAPLAPWAAIRQIGETLKLEEIVAAGKPLAGRYDTLIVEGAGGVAVPLAEDGLVVDLIAALGLPALIVAHPGLGTVNHTLLTAAFLRQRAVPIVGVLLNDGIATATESQDDPSIELNDELIERFGALRVLGRLPRIREEADSRTWIRGVRQAIDFDPIRRAIRGDGR